MVECWFGNGIDLELLNWIKFWFNVDFEMELLNGIKCLQVFGQNSFSSESGIYTVIEGQQNISHPTGHQSNPEIIHDVR